MQAFPGRDLSPMLTGRVDAAELDAPIYFMTQDRITTGLRERGIVSREPYEGVAGNASVESVIAHHDGELWKLNHYYDVDPARAAARRRRVVWELHNLTRDPEERENLADGDEKAFAAMHALLDETRGTQPTDPRAHQLEPELEPTCVSRGVYTPFVDAGSLSVWRATSRWWRRGRGRWGRGRSRGSWLARSTTRPGGRPG